MTATYMGFPAVVESSEAVDANTIRVKLRFETPAERAARRRALLAEARAWRTCAELAVTTPVYDGVDAWTQREHMSRVFRWSPTWDAMLERNRRHGDGYFDWGVTPTEGRDVAILRALWLELECRDEAAALLPTGRAPRQKKGGRRHA